jgi:hypothetical protein
VGVDLVKLTRERMLAEGWQLAICLTDIPIHFGRRPVTAHVSVSLGVGVVSVPALGAVDLVDRVQDALMRAIDELVTGSLTKSQRSARNSARIRAQVLARFRKAQQLASPLGLAHVQDQTTVRFVTAAGHGNLRLLIGMVRANRPWRLIVGLSRALVAALGAGAFGLTSPPIWQIATVMGVSRMVLLAVGSLVTIAATLIVAHELWERSPSPQARERVILINLATMLTIAIGVCTLYAALLVITGVCDTALIPPAVIERYVQHPVGLGGYLRIAWVVSSLATLGGALGAALESGAAVREAAYGYRSTERKSS